MKPSSEDPRIQLVTAGLCILGYSDRGWDRVTPPGVNHHILYIYRMRTNFISHEFDCQNNFPGSL